MRGFANSYIILFLIDAALSFVDELLISSSAPISFLAEIR